MTPVRPWSQNAFLLSAKGPNDMYYSMEGVNPLSMTFVTLVSLFRKVTPTKGGKGQRSE